MNILRRKSFDDLLAHTQEKKLNKALGAFDITLMGLGIIIGTGIFVLTGIGAAKYAGPGLMLSFVFAAITCAFVCLAYSELASFLPVSGSSYTYAYASLGEIFGWWVGWSLILEYSVGASAVAGGWSAYFVGILHSCGIDLPKALTAVPADGGIINLPAVLILCVIAFIHIHGVRQSATVNNIIVAIKLAVVALFLALGFSHVDAANWVPFMPYGWSGVFAGASIIFFAYIGFDAVSTAAEEVKNPQKDLPRGIILSLIICTVLYIAVSAVLTGMVPYLEFKTTAAPVAFALQAVGYHWGAAAISVGAICGLTSVLLVMSFGQSRVLFVMSRDGLLPKFFGHVHPKYKTPARSSLLVCVVTAITAGFLPINIVAEMTNIGTLCAFIIVSAAVIVLRKKNPNQERAFKCPLVPLVPLLAIAFCGVLIYMLPLVTQIRFVVWLLLGLAIYFGYGYNHSIISQARRGQLGAAPVPGAVAPAEQAAQEGHPANH